MDHSTVPVRAATEITDMSATEIAGAIASGEISSRDAVDAHIDRIQSTHRQLNAVVVQLFDEARTSAAAADNKRSNGESLGPLHGVPITVKECYDVAGTATTGGLLNMAADKASADAPMVQRMRNAGAIVLGKTNLPHLMLFNEGDNPLYGRTNNPWNLERSPGGGSSGEGSIIAAHGSPLGLASDYGGSVRIPPHFCGIHGFKCTSGRLTMKGTFDARLFPGLETIIDQPGPMSRSVADLLMAFRILAAPGVDQIDVRAQPRPVPDPGAVNIRGLKIGFYQNDNVFDAAPACRRAVREAASALRDRGAEVEEFVPYDIHYGRHIFLGLISAGGAAWAKKLAGKDKIDKRSGHPMKLGAVPQRGMALLSHLVEKSGQVLAADFMRSVGGRSTKRYWELILERDRYREQFYQVLDRYHLDAILCPPNPFPAYKHGASYELTSQGSYTQVYNLLGMPCGAVAATRVRSGEETERPSDSKDLVVKAARNTEEGSAGMPVGVQVVARHWREDVALAVMAALEEHFKAQPDYPHKPSL